MVTHFPSILPFPIPIVLGFHSMLYVLAMHLVNNNGILLNSSLGPHFCRNSIINLNHFSWFIHPLSTLNNRCNNRRGRGPRTTPSLLCPSYFIFLYHKTNLFFSFFPSFPENFFRGILCFFSLVALIICLEKLILVGSLSNVKAKFA